MKPPTDFPSMQPIDPEKADLHSSSESTSNTVTETEQKTKSGTRLFGWRRPSKPRRMGTFFQLQMIFITAFFMATLFTTWTPGFYSPPPTQQSANILNEPTKSESPVAQVSATARGPLLIGVVAGHWKNDSGAVCPDGLKEVQVNLDIASQVQKNLADQGFKVDLLKEFDPRLENYKAAALISIHADSCEFVNNQATGFKVAAALATKHPERTARLTACLRSRYSGMTNLALHSTSVTPDMTLYHAFDEIDPETPAAIIETGFLNLDRKLLTKKPELVAKGISDGILCYLRNENIPAATSSPGTSGVTPLPTLPSATP